MDTAGRRFGSDLGPPVSLISVVTYLGPRGAGPALEKCAISKP